MASSDIATSICRSDRSASSSNVKTPLSFLLSDPNTTTSSKLGLRLVLPLSVTNATQLAGHSASSMERSPAGRHEESDDCIVPRKPRTKPSDIGGGDGGGKAVGRRKGAWLRMSRTQSRNRHVTEAARPRIGAAWAAQAPMADHVRPSTGARCVSSARRDLCGGSGVTRPLPRPFRGRIQ